MNILRYNVYTIYIIHINIIKYWTYIDFASMCIIWSFGHYGHYAGPYNTQFSVHQIHSNLTTGRLPVTPSKSDEKLKSLSEIAYWWPKTCLYTVNLVCETHYVTSLFVRWNKWILLSEKNFEHRLLKMFRFFFR